MIGKNNDSLKEETPLPRTLSLLLLLGRPSLDPQEFTRIQNREAAINHYKSLLHKALEQTDVTFLVAILPEEDEVDPGEAPKFLP